VKIGHRRIEREETVKRERWDRALKAQCLVATQLTPVRIPNRRDHGKPVERAAQNHGEEARIAAFSARKLR